MRPLKKASSRERPTAKVGAGGIRPDETGEKGEKGWKGKERIRREEKNENVIEMNGFCLLFNMFCEMSSASVRAL